MSLRTIPSKRWTDPGEDLVYGGLEGLPVGGLDLAAQPTVLIEPETIGSRIWVDADMRTILASAPAGQLGIWESFSDQTIPAQGQLLLDRYYQDVSATIAQRQVILCDQRNSKVYFRAYSQRIAADNGSLIQVVQMVGHNLALTDAAIALGYQVRFIATYGNLIAQPTKPAHYLLITPGKRWQTANEAVSAPDLNRTAAPTAAFAPLMIGAIELNGRALQRLAQTVIGLRGSFTTSSTTIAQGTTATLGTATIAGATTSMIVKVGQGPVQQPLLSAYVSAANTVTVQARHNGGSGSIHLGGGKVVTLLVLKAT